MPLTDAVSDELCGMLSDGVGESVVESVIGSSCVTLVMVTDNVLDGVISPDREVVRLR